MFGDVSISFVDHNKGRNWGAVNFNRECWLLLLGFPPEFREDNFVVNSISSFGRVISWVDDDRHLSRILVKARVIDLESVPQFLVLTDGEGFQGESWTVQCEVLQGNLLGALPEDEAPAPGPDDFPLGGPFDLFGFGLQGPGPAPPNPNVNAGHNLFQAELPEGDAFQGNHNVQNVQAQDLQGFQGQNMQVQDEGWNEWSDNEQLVGGFDLNENPEDVQGLDLNEVPDPQEMIIDPVFPGPQLLNQQMNAFLDQVNEGEEDAQFVQEQLAPIEAELAQALAAPLEVQVEIPALDFPMDNYLPLDLQEDDLMGEEEIQQLIQEEENNINVPAPNSQNLQVGMVLTRLQPMDPYLGRMNHMDSYLGHLNLGSKGSEYDKPFCFGSEEPWAGFFNSNSSTKIEVPVEWAKFFASLLMSPSHFHCVKKILQSAELVNSLGSSLKVGIPLPDKCSEKLSPFCSLKLVGQSVNPVPNSSSQAEVFEVDSDEAPPLTDVPPPKSKKKAAVVETEVRRSPRLKVNKMGFKNPICHNKSCLGCSISPPTLSNKAIKKIGTLMCDLKDSELEEKTLNKKKGKLALVGSSQPKKNEDPMDDDNEELSNKE
jgi:hypothetical protein